MERHPAAHADTEGGDLVLAPAPEKVRAAVDPDADAAVAPLAAHGEARQSRDDPRLELADEGADVLLAAREVEHHIGHALAGPVIGVLAAATGLVDREARLDQVARFRRRAGGVERRMLEQPHGL